MSKKVGQQLRREREARSLTLEQVAKTTHMRLRYLKAMEDGEFDVLPSMAQARGFLRAYASYLDLDEAPLLVLLDGEETPEPQTPIAIDSGPETSPPPQAEAAEEIFVKIGYTLNHQRELLGLSLDDVERHTHLRKRYLEALESGNLQGLPSPVQGRGMLNNYAAFLGLDAEPLMLRFAEGLQLRLAARQAVEQKPEPRPKRSLPAPVRRIFSADVLIGGALVIFLAAFVFWGAMRISSMQADQEPTPTAPSIADVLLATSTPTLTATPLPATPTSPPSELLFPTQALPTDSVSGEPIPASEQGEIQIYITVSQRAWMRVVVDGEIEFDGRVIPGSAYAFTGELSIEILTGNGAALSVFFNQQDLGRLGAFGQVVHKVYTLQGILAPTATITLTPTATEPATATPDTAGTPVPPSP